MPPRPSIGLCYGKLASLFDEARQRAPAVLFFDEVEAIGGSRQQIRHSPGKTLVSQLLAEMDGVAGSNSRVLVFANTGGLYDDLLAYLGSRG